MYISYSINWESKLSLIAPSKHRAPVLSCYAIFPSGKTSKKLSGLLVPSPFCPASYSLWKERSLLAHESIEMENYQ